MEIIVNVIYNPIIGSVMWLASRSARLYIQKDTMFNTKYSSIKA